MFKEGDVKDSFTFFHWNVLSFSYCCETVYSKISPEFLARKHRTPLIFKEILRYDPDIISLQEVEDVKLFTEHFGEEYIGFFGSWHLKPPELGLFYKKNKFDLEFNYDIKKHF